MGRKLAPVLGVLMVLAGLGGLIWAFGWWASAPLSLEQFTSAGQRIYYTGADSQDRPIPRSIAGAGIMGYGMMGSAACVDCHGRDGRGGSVGMMFGTVEIPDVRYSVLAAPRSDNGTTTPGWSDGDIARAIVDGIEPNGQHLQAPMPRWNMTDSEIAQVIAYLKELDAK